MPKKAKPNTSPTEQYIFAGVFLLLIVGIVALYRHQGNSFTPHTNKANTTQQEAQVGP